MFVRYEGKAWEERFLPRLSSKQIAEMDKSQALVVLSVGAIEQHGPHLPVMTDSLIGEATLTAALEKLEPQVPVWLLPPLSYGKSNEHIGFPGTISLSAATLQAVVTDIAASLAASGFRKLLLFNTHGGNADLLNVIAREIRLQCGMTVFSMMPGSVAKADDLMGPEELEFGIHGGDYETSIVKSIKPDWVADELAPRDIPDMSRYRYLSLEGSIRFAWKTADISATGVCGNAAAATADKGRIIQERAAGELAKAFAEMCTFSVEDVRGGSGV